MTATMIDYPLLSCREAAAYLAMTEREIRAAIHHRDHPLPYYKLGPPGSKFPLRFSRADLDEWQLGATPQGLDPRPQVVTDPFDHVVDNIDLQRAIHRIKQALPAREWQILSMRWGLPPYTHPHTHDEIGEELTLTRERVRQLQHQAEGKAQEELERPDRQPDSKPQPRQPLKEAINRAWRRATPEQRRAGIHVVQQEAPGIGVWQPRDAADAERFYEALRRGDTLEQAINPRHP